jgi:hypothetical protein
VAAQPHLYDDPQLRNVQRQHICSLKHSTYASNTSSVPRTFLQYTYTTEFLTFCIYTVLHTFTNTRFSLGTDPTHRRNLTPPSPANSHKGRARWVSSKRKAVKTRSPHEHLSLAPVRRTRHHRQPRTPTLLPRRVKTPTPTHPQPTQVGNQTNTGVRRAQP